MKNGSVKGTCSRRWLGNYSDNCTSNSFNDIYAWIPDPRTQISCISWCGLRQDPHPHAREVTSNTRDWGISDNPISGTASYGSWTKVGNGEGTTRSSRREILYCDWASNQCLRYPATTSVEADINLIRTSPIV